MQTFLPYAEFNQTMLCLDDRRLGKQRVEAYQILKKLLQFTPGWKNHPAVLMWEGYEDALALYGVCACLEWKRRGFKDDLVSAFTGLVHVPDDFEPTLPFWLGDDRLHDSHKSVLLWKEPRHYRQFNWSVAPSRTYFWPVTKIGIT